MARNPSVMGLYPDRTTVSDAISVLHIVRNRVTDISVFGWIVGWLADLRLSELRRHPSYVAKRYAGTETPSEQSAEYVVHETKKWEATAT